MLEVMMKDGAGPQASALLREFRQALRALEREVELCLLAQTDCCGVSVAQCHLLLELEIRGEGSIGDFAGLLDLDASTLSRTVDGLVRGGLLLRADDPVNRRRQIVSLSEAGKAKLDSINALCDDYYRSLLSPFSEDQREKVREGVALLAEAMRSRRKSGDLDCCSGPPKLSKEH
jgi:DNA-binding MarR family transcriptional regulator